MEIEMDRKYKGKRKGMGTPSNRGCRWQRKSEARRVKGSGLRRRRDLTPATRVTFTHLG